MSFRPAARKDVVILADPCTRISRQMYPYVEIRVHNHTDLPNTLEVDQLVGTIQVEVGVENPEEEVWDKDNGERGMYAEHTMGKLWIPPRIARKEEHPVEEINPRTLTLPLPKISLSETGKWMPNPIRWELTGLTVKHQEEMNALLSENRDVFAGENDPLGRCEILPFRVETGDAPPVSQRPIRVSPKQEHLIKAGVEELLTRGLISESDSPYGAPVLLVPKKDGKVRLCINYRKLNAQLVPVTWPIPHITDTLAKLGKARYFSTLDLKAGYDQIVVE